MKEMDLPQVVPTTEKTARQSLTPDGTLAGTRLVGFMLAHEQFTVPQLIQLGHSAARSGFDLLATSDHFQPWQANEGHSGTPGSRSGRWPEASARHGWARP